MRELISAANHERVKRVTWLKLRSAVPIKPRLRSGMSADRDWRRRKPPIVTHRSCRWIILGRDELHVMTIHIEIVERFLNQVRVFISHMTELRSRNADVHDSIAGVTVTRRLQPSVI